MGEWKDHIELIVELARQEFRDLPNRNPLKVDLLQPRSGDALPGIRVDASNFFICPCFPRILPDEHCRHYQFSGRSSKRMKEAASDGMGWDDNCPPAPTPPNRTEPDTIC